MNTTTTNSKNNSQPSPAVSPAAGGPPTDLPDETQCAQPRKRRNTRAGKKKRSRRKSFAAMHEDAHEDLRGTSDKDLYQFSGGNLSDTSLDSEALLDHSRLRMMQNANGDDNAPPARWDETTPLLLGDARRPGSQGISSHGASDTKISRTRASSASSRARLATGYSAKDKYDVNHPPSMPGSPTLGPLDRGELGFGDVMITEDVPIHGISPGRSLDDDDDAVLGRDEDVTDRRSLRERSRLAPEAAGDVCFPPEGLSDICDDENQEPRRFRSRRRRPRWPDLSILEEWMRFEKEDRSDERRVKKITEPQLINGRLRPVRKGWYQTEEDAPYRFTYFNEEFQSTIHSQTISELVQQGSDFQELFIPEPRILSDDESESEDEDGSADAAAKPQNHNPGADGDRARQSSVFSNPRYDGRASPLQQQKFRTESLSIAASLSDKPNISARPSNEDVLKGLQPDGKPARKSVRYGDRPVWWLDILCPTEEEMKVLSKAFGIHPLTAEDIMVQEAREKVELFRHYYFVNYRTFDQDINSDNYLEPVNMYVVVFREGVLSFHFSVTPHPANVRRRIRQLRDYLILSSDWISYAIIDDITDVFQPLIQNIEDEVDEIDEAILQLHSSTDRHMNPRCPKGDDASTITDSSGDMLRRVGDCRKRVMSLYRLLGNKADVIKGFAKRCNEGWEVAPKSEIGLYLGDIQDHIVTMTSNLSHYEKILARSHGNYLAQINIRMNQRQEETADVLGKLTVLGTIVLPMNIITGLWGMNVWVPGQDNEGDLTWFICITAGLIVFGLGCYWTAKRVYNLV
ncbi:putative metal ion transporter [Escovopsis weberi]|uniref:Putative metal ion transporter n=1 Tax=Escovopsis weberi TaxID=150374 RepID=A0A0M9VTV5_ESCWE|nr:putative metal ion transporter [Escovopsis weberi]